MHEILRHQYHRKRKFKHCFKNSSLKLRILKMLSSNKFRRLCHVLWTFYPKTKHALYCGWGYRPSPLTDQNAFKPAQKLNFASSNSFSQKRMEDVKATILFFILTFLERSQAMNFSALRLLYSDFTKKCLAPSPCYVAYSTSTLHFYHSTLQYREWTVGTFNTQAGDVHL